MRARWCLSAAAALAFFAGAAGAQAPGDDGPHVHHLGPGRGVEAVWSCGGRVERRTLAAVVGTVVPALCGYPRPVVLADERAEFPVPTRHTARRLAAISDIHGQFGLLRQLLQAHGVIGEALDWRFGDGHLLVLGDVMGRGPQVTEALWLLHQLDAQAQRHGGRVHMLLGNHETMSLQGDLRYLNPKYAALAEDYGRPYPAWFDEQSVLGRWLRRQPVVLQVGDTLFLHAGLHPGALDVAQTPAEINERFRLSLGLPRPVIRAHPALSVLYGGSGPIWYRGYFNAPRLSDEALRGVLERLQVARIVVGHTTMSGVFSHHGGRVLSIDSDIRSGRSGELLLYTDGAWQRGTLAGERLPIPERPAGEATGPDN